MNAVLQGVSIVFADGIAQSASVTWNEPYLDTQAPFEDGSAVIYAPTAPDGRPATALRTVATITVA